MSTVWPGTFTTILPEVEPVMTMTPPFAAMAAAFAVKNAAFMVSPPVPLRVTVCATADGSVKQAASISTASVKDAALFVIFVVIFIIM
jgi:hypothetical protein